MLPLCWDFPGGPGVKNPPANTGDMGSMGSIPGLGRKIPLVTRQLSPHTLKLIVCNPKLPQEEALAPQLESSPRSLQLEKACAQP